VTLDAIDRQMRALGSPEGAAAAARFFRTGPGEYGEGDVFLGLRAAQVHALAKEHRALPMDDVLALLRSPIHEKRMLAVLLLANAYPKADEAGRQRIHDAYLAHTAWINNWDLVDASAPQVVGAHLRGRDRAPLAALAASPLLWERRIAMVATLHFIRAGELGPTLDVAERLLGDRHDLIHKAAGWMLREVGKRDRAVLEGFLRRHLGSMPRTMLRYAIERFPEPLRRAYLRGDAAAIAAEGG
jgi:3-methyladenine DNA glycosylase AlkD